MNIFQIAKALGADDLTSPTIPYIPVTGSITPTPILGNGPSILLQTNVVTLKKGDKALVEVVVFTNKQDIKSFKFKVKFDPTAFKVVDKDSAIAGTQITYVNTFFVQKTNTVNDQGEILFEASTTEGVARISSSVVANFEMESLKNGSFLITLDKTESNLINNLNTDILETVNSVVLTVSDNTVVVTTGVPTPVISGIPSITPSRITPKTGWIDDIGYNNAIIGGTLLIISGIYLYKKSKSHELL